MCDKCAEIDKTIESFRRLRKEMLDVQMRESAAKHILKLEAEKRALHPK
jgi:hypothetical protein